MNVAKEPHDTALHVMSNDEFDAGLTKEMVKRTDKLNDLSIDLALRLKQAREFMAWSNNHMRTAWLDWQKESETVIKDLTQFRMAFDRETKTVIAAGKDIAEFFNSNQYQQAHALLKVMVDTLERFQLLKENGTLDAFADFILKVSCK